MYNINIHNLRVYH